MNQLKTTPHLFYGLMTFVATPVMFMFLMFVGVASRSYTLFGSLAWIVGFSGWVWVILWVVAATKTRRHNDQLRYQAMQSYNVHRGY